MEGCACLQRYADWAQKFGQHLGKKVVMLTGETSVDLRLLRDVRVVSDTVWFCGVHCSVLLALAGESDHQYS